MKYDTPGALRMALERRLLETSKQTRLPLTRLRKAVVFERMLARLVRADGERWVLKGAVALEFRTGGQTRATKDLDLGYERAQIRKMLSPRSKPARGKKWGTALCSRSRRP